VRQCGAVQARDVISGDDPRMGVFGAAIAEILACYGAAAAALTWINLQESPASGNDDDGNSQSRAGGGVLPSRSSKTKAGISAKRAYIRSDPTTM
jgi:hypothetical protein